MSNYIFITPLHQNALGILLKVSEVEEKVSDSADELNGMGGMSYLAVKRLS